MLPFVVWCSSCGAVLRVRYSTVYVLCVMSGGFGIACVVANFSSVKGTLCSGGVCSVINFPSV